jgi:hypothetical protein
LEGEEELIIDMTESPIDRPRDIIEERKRDIV